MRLLVVAGTSFQCQPITKHLKEFCPSILVDEIIVRDKLLNNNHKNLNNVSFFQGIARCLFLGEYSRGSFSYYHVALSQNYSKHILINYFYKSIALFSRKKPILARKIRIICEYLLRTTSKKPKIHYDFVIFVGTLSAKIELDIYYAYINLRDTKLLYVPTNWDNPFGKLYIPNSGFFASFAWGEQMNRIFANVPEIQINIISPNPRLSYLLSVQEHRSLNWNKSSTCKVLVALSQKNNFNKLIHSLKEIASSLLSQYTEIEFVVKPHPYSPLEEHDWSYLDGLAKIVYDDSYVWSLKHLPLGSIPGSFEDFHILSEESLIKSFKSVDFLITEASTLTVEALTIGIPCVVLLNNSSNKTMRVHAHFDHFNEITNEINCLCVFTEYKLKERFEVWYKLLESHKKCILLNNYYIELDKIMNLSRYLENK